MLACPQDARLRDKYAVLFTLEVLLSLQRMEDSLRAVCSSSRDEINRVRGSMKPGTSGVDDCTAWSPLTLALMKIKLVPQIISEERIGSLQKDLRSGKKRDRESVKQREGIGRSSHSTVRDPPSRCSRERDVPPLLFAHWEWVVCVVALETVESAILLRSIPTEPEVKTYSGAIRLD